jgi:hypothetical protein
LATGVLLRAVPADPSEPQDIRGYTAQQDAAVAGRLKLTTQQVQLLHEQRSMTNSDLIRLAESPAKLRRALRRARVGDLPAQRAAFRALRESGEGGQPPPADAVPRAIREMERLRPSQPGAIADAGRRRINPRRLIAPAAAALASEDSLQGKWEWLGPGNIGGRTRSIVIDPGTPTRIWVGSVGGGIWVSEDGGGSFTPADDFMASLAVSCMAMDPVDTKTIYAGTGESFASFEGLSGDPSLLGFSPDGIRGAGVFRTTDGKNWSQLPSTTGTDFQFVNRLSLARQAGGPSVLLAATTKGMFRSEGSDRADLSSNNVLPNVDVADVDFNPTDRNKAIAGGRLNGEAYYSENGGKTWTPATHSGQWSGRVELTYAMKDPTVVYLSVYKIVLDPTSGKQTVLSTVYRSTDGGKSYGERKALTLDEQTGTSVSANPLGGQGDYGNVIWAGDPSNANLVVVGGIDLWRSIDGGDNFDKISAWDESPQSAHADHHVIVADPRYDGTMNRTVYFGNDGGLYRTMDVTTVGGPAVIGGVSFKHAAGWGSINNGYGVTQFYGAAGNIHTGFVFGGAQDNGTLRYRPSDGPQNWFTVITGDGGYCASNPTDTPDGRNLYYSEYVYADVQRSVNGGTPLVGDPNPDADNISGHFWNTLDPDHPHWDWKAPPFVIADARDSDQDNLHPKANFIAPLVLDPNNSNRLLVGGVRLWCTDDPQTPNSLAGGANLESDQTADHRGRISLQRERDCSRPRPLEYHLGWAQ